MCFSSRYQKMRFFQMREKTKNEDDRGSERQGIPHEKEALEVFSKVGIKEPRATAVYQARGRPGHTGADGWPAPGGRCLREKE